MSKSPPYTCGGEGRQGAGGWWRSGAGAIPSCSRHVGAQAELHPRPAQQPCPLCACASTELWRPRKSAAAICWSQASQDMAELHQTFRHRRRGSTTGHPRTLAWTTLSCSPAAMPSCCSAASTSAGRAAGGTAHSTPCQRSRQLRAAAARADEPLRPHWTRGGEAGVHGASLRAVKGRSTRSARARTPMPRHAAHRPCNTHVRATVRAPFPQRPAHLAGYGGAVRELERPGARRQLHALALAVLPKDGAHGLQDAQASVVAVAARACCQRLQTLKMLGVVDRVGDQAQRRRGRQRHLRGSYKGTRRWAGGHWRSQRMAALISMLAGQVGGQVTYKGAGGLKAVAVAAPAVGNATTHLPRQRSWPG